MYSLDISEYLTSKSFVPQLQLQIHLFVSSLIATTVSLPIVLPIQLLSLHIPQFVFLFVTTLYASIILLLVPHLQLHINAGLLFSVVSSLIVKSLIVFPIYHQYLAYKHAGFEETTWLNTFLPYCLSFLHYNKQQER